MNIIGFCANKNIIASIDKRVAISEADNLILLVKRLHRLAIRAREKIMAEPRANRQKSGFKYNSINPQAIEPKNAISQM